VHDERCIVYKEVLRGCVQTLLFFPKTTPWLCFVMGSQHYCMSAVAGKVAFCVRSCCGVSLYVCWIQSVTIMCYSMTRTSIHNAVWNSWNYCITLVSVEYAVLRCCVAYLKLFLVCWGYCMRLYFAAVLLIWNCFLCADDTVWDCTSLLCCLFETALLSRTTSSLWRLSEDRVVFLQWLRCLMGV
jgi:hypothetical protein